MELLDISVEKIKIAGEQVRTNFDREKLRSLAESIKEVGQLQPVIVRKQGEDYVLIAGERRYRAIKEKNAQKKIAAIVLDKDINARQIQLIENLQRQSLNPLERAKAIDLYIKENNLTRKEASSKLGIARTTMTEWLNILEVKPVYQKAVLDENSTLSLSHITLARALEYRTGDVTKANDLLDGVLKYNFTRKECQQIVELFKKYLHMPLEEAFAAILLKRAKKENLSKQQRKNNNRQEKETAGNIVKALNRVSDNLEKYLARVGQLDKKQDRENILGEFLYIYQLLEMVMPELQKNSVKQLINKVKNQQAAGEEIEGD